MGGLSPQQHPWTKHQSPWVLEGLSSRSSLEGRDCFRGCYVRALAPRPFPSRAPHRRALPPALCRAPRAAMVPSDRLRVPVSLQVLPRTSLAGDTSRRFSLTGVAGLSDAAVCVCVWACCTCENSSRRRWALVFQRMVLGLRRNQSFKRLLFVRSRIGFHHGTRASEKHVSEVGARRVRSESGQ